MLPTCTVPARSPTRQYLVTKGLWNYSCSKSLPGRSQRDPSVECGEPGRAREECLEGLLHRPAHPLPVPPPPATEIAAAGLQSFPKLAREPQVWPGDTGGVAAVEPAGDSMHIYGGGRGPLWASMFSAFILSWDRSHTPKLQLLPREGAAEESWRTPYTSQAG